MFPLYVTATVWATVHIRIGFRARDPMIFPGGGQNPMMPDPARCETVQEIFLPRDMTAYLRASGA